MRAISHLTPTVDQPFDVASSSVLDGRESTGIAWSKRFCLITCGNVCNRPRLVKEADCLAAAGHYVRVIAVDIDPRIAGRDDATATGRAWHLHRIAMRRGTVRGTVARAKARGTQTAAIHMRRLGLGIAQVEDLALSRYFAPFVREGSSKAADVVIGHGIEALPVAARVATLLGASLGFDAEDFHTGELPPEGQHLEHIGLVRDVERRYLPQCTYLTAASDGIADALVEAYGIKRPIVVLNTFSGVTGTVRPLRAMQQGRLSLYWFSQVIGPGRGVEDAVTALGSLPPGVELHLRGQPDPEFVRSIRAEASALGVVDRLFLWPAVDPEALIPLAMEHDVGLALELREPRNRDLCVTNKLFVYLTAGLAVAASDTSGQRSVLHQAPNAGFLFPAGNSQALANGLRRLVETPETLAGMKLAALEASTARFQWSTDAARLVAYLSDQAVPGVLT